jgi:hypothetical protein
MVSIHSKINRQSAGRRRIACWFNMDIVCAISGRKIFLRMILVLSGIFFGTALILSPWRILRCRRMDLPQAACRQAWAGADITSAWPR